VIGFILKKKLFQESFENAFEILEKEKKEIGIISSRFLARRPSLASLSCRPLFFFPQSRIGPAHSTAAAARLGPPLSLLR
jgi:hypothetical protein